MRALLDTHAFLWYVLDDVSLGPNAKQVINDGSNEILVSPASYWEVAIKVSLGKYVLSLPFEDFWRRNIVLNRFTVLPVQIEHAGALITMPYHHRDPFDRLLVAQATVEGVPLLSADGVLDVYGIRRIW